MCIIGQILLRMGGGDFPGRTFPRLSNGGTFAVDLLGLSGSGATLEARIEHKNLEDTGWTTAATFASMNAVDIYTVNVAALKEQWRYVYSIGGSNPTNMAHYDELGVLWRPPLGSCPPQ